MKEIKNEEAVLLEQEDLEEATGGIDNPKGMFLTVADVENSPIFDKLKTWLGKYKKAGHSKTAPATVYKLRGYVGSYEYLINDHAAFGFIKKYWDLV